MVRRFNARELATLIIDLLVEAKRRMSGSGSAGVGGPPSSPHHQHQQYPQHLTSKERGEGTRSLSRCLCVRGYVYRVVCVYVCVCMDVCVGVFVCV